MIKARFHKTVDGQDANVIFLGLEEGNIVNLKKGMPIVVDLRDMGLTGEVIIHYGATKADMMNDLRIVGLLPGAMEGNAN